MLPGWPGLCEKDVRTPPRCPLWFYPWFEAYLANWWCGGAASGSLIGRVLALMIIPRTNQLAVVIPSSALVAG